MDRIEARIEDLPISHRLAFSAACSVRVLPVYELEHHACAALMREANDLVWRAAQGMLFTPAALDHMRDEVSAAIPDQQEDHPGYTTTILAGVALLNAIDAVEDPSGEACAQVAQCAVDALSQVNDDAALGAEEEWQLAILEALEGWGAKRISRDMFRAIDGSGPQRRVERWG